jgi:Kef-type K+ transport system membrane component KefB
VTDDQILLLLIDVVVLVGMARLGGELAVRLGIAPVVGELVAGILLGPSVLGVLWPGGFDALFPQDVTHRAFLDLFSWIGVIILVLLAGIETQLGIVRRAGAVLGAWAGGFVLPFAGGFTLGLLFPAGLIPAGVDRPVFALFLAIAMSMSAIPVIARILMDLNLYRTRVGMVIVASAVIDDTTGWIVLALVAGMVAGGAGSIGIVPVVLLTGAFLLAAAAFGTRAVRTAIRFARLRLRLPFAELSMVILLVLASGAVTHAIGVHLVLGSFVMAVLIGRLRKLDRAAIQPLRHVGMALFVSFFFAYTGIKVNLTTLHGSALLFAVALASVACAGKILGGAFGARLGGLLPWEAWAVGFGRNARGAMELVIAAIGLSIGVLNETTYAMVVLLAVCTDLSAAPLLRLAVARGGLKPSFDEEGEAMAMGNASGPAVPATRGAGADAGAARRR